VTTALSFVIILTGALVRGSGATLACVDWPLCNGAILPVNQGQLALIHMFHRFSVLALGVALALLVWIVLRQRADRTVRLLAVGGAALYLAQATVGAIFVLTAAAPLWGALHVGLAASTWGALVALSVIETVNTREQTAKAAWQPQPDPQQA
jgi:cytochrome c oxidase assembly protein subunit 15